MSDASATEPLVRCRGLTKRYVTASGAVEALRGVDLDLAPGGFLAITGPSGCGKTTLLNLLGALDRPSAGEARVAGRELAALGTRARALYRREVVGFVFQQFHLSPSLTAQENVALPLEYAGVARAVASERAAALLERVGLARRADHLPALLSGGEQQRVAVARALVGGARLLLADEPTGNLDGATAQDVLRLFDEVRADGLGIVLVTHDPAVAARAERELKLRDGRVEEER